MIFGQMSFSGVDHVISGQFSLTTGISPSMAVLEIAPQKIYTTVGTLKIWDGNNTIVFKNCCIDTGTFEYNQQGEVCRLYIKDRRWKWGKQGGGGKISGMYNIRNDQGEIVKITARHGIDTMKQSAQRLFQKCLNALGENGYDVGSVPNFYPTVSWDTVTPADAIAELCDKLSLVVVLGLNDKIKVVPIGTGNELPQLDSVVQYSKGIVVNNKPYKIGIVCSPTVFNVWFNMEAVGVENDENRTVKLIEELSYKPSNGWQNETFEFDNVAVEFGEVCQKLARQHVFRSYRIVVPVRIFGYLTGMNNDKTSSEIHERWKILLRDKQVVYSIRNTNVQQNVPIIRPPTIFGTFLDNEDFNGKNTTGYVPSDSSSSETNNHDWRLDTTTGIVTFNHPIVRNRPGANVGDPIKLFPATLLLNTSCTILDEFEFAPVRYVYEEHTGGDNKTPTRYEMSEDLVVWYCPDTSVRGSSKIYTNERLMSIECKKRIKEIMKEYNTKTPQTATYGGIIKIGPDGKVLNVTWMVGNHDCVTVASYNCEQFNKITSRRQKRNIENYRYQRGLINDVEHARSKAIRLRAGNEGLK